MTHVPNGSDGYHHPLCMLPITTKEINLGWYSVFSTIGVASEWDKFKPYKVKPTGYYDESVSVQGQWLKDNCDDRALNLEKTQRTLGSFTKKNLEDFLAIIATNPEWNMRDPEHVEQLFSYFKGCQGITIEIPSVEQ